MECNRIDNSYVDPQQTQSAEAPSFPLFLRDMNQTVDHYCHIPIPSSSYAGMSESIPTVDPDGTTYNNFSNFISSNSYQLMIPTDDTPGLLFNGGSNTFSSPFSDFSQELTELLGVPSSSSQVPVGTNLSYPTNDTRLVMGSYNTSHLTSITPPLQPLGSSLMVNGPLSPFPLSGLAIAPSILAAAASTSLNLRRLVHPKKRRERTTIDDRILSIAFKDGSLHPDQQRRALFEAIFSTEFYRNQQHEPTLGSSEASEILAVAGTPTLANDAPPKASIFALFADRERNKCLICGKICAVLERVIGCIRKHFHHRPYSCHGQYDGCNSCSVSQPARFFTASGLTDHLSKQEKQDTCPFPGCDASLRIGGVPRHYKSKHPSFPVPDMRHERQRSRNDGSSSNRHFPY